MDDRFPWYSVCSSRAHYCGETLPTLHCTVLLSPVLGNIFLICHHKLVNCKPQSLRLNVNVSIIPSIHSRKPFFPPFSWTFLFTYILISNLITGFKGLIRYTTLVISTVWLEQKTPNFLYLEPCFSLFFIWLGIRNRHKVNFEIQH